MAANDAAPGKTGVILIHGIGAARPGEVLTETVEALQKREGCALDVSDTTEVRRFEERGEGAPQDKIAFPNHRRRARDAATGRETVFSELFWSDVKSVDVGMLSPIFLFLSTVLQSHRIIGALLAGRSPIAMVMRAFLLCGAFVLRGPIVGLNLTMIFVLLAIKYCAIAQRFFGFPEMFQGFYFVLGGLMFAALTGLILVSQRFFTSRFFYEIGVATLTWCAIGVAVAVYVLGDQPPQAFNEHDFFVKGWLLLVVLWLAMTALIAVAFVLLPLGLVLFFRRDGVRENRALVLGFAILLFQTTIWALAVRLFWLSFSGDLAVAIDRASLDLLSSAATLKSLQYTVLFNVVSLATVFGAILFVAATRWAIARMAPRAPSPRLMFSPLALNLAIIVVMTGYFSSLGLLFERAEVELGFAMPVTTQLQLIAAWLYEVIDQRSLEFAVSTLIVLSPALLFMFNQTLAYSSMLLQDLIDHQTPPRTDAGRRRGRKPSPRARISDRFDLLLHDLAEREKVDSLVVLAHSQGTVIAFDHISEMSNVCRRRGMPLKVITLGSPLGHIYAHYFENYRLFPKILDEAEHGLSAWINFYRIDDAIGTYMSSAKDCFVEERPLAPGGHRGYWSQRVVGDEILASLGAPRSPKPAAAPTPAALIEN